MRRGARWIQLHRDACIENLPARAEIVEESRMIPPVMLGIHRGHEALLAVHRRVVCGHACFGKPRRQHAVSRGEPGMKGLHHRSEVPLQT